MSFSLVKLGRFDPVLGFPWCCLDTAQTKQRRTSHIIHVIPFLARRDFEYMHIDMYVIKHHNIIPSDMSYQRNGQIKLSKHFLLNADSYIWEQMPTPMHEWSLAL